MTTRKAARPLRRYVRARVRPALLLPANYTTCRDATLISAGDGDFAPRDGAIKCASCIRKRTFEPTGQSSTLIDRSIALLISKVCAIQDLNKLQTRAFNL
jgi:hypothetical protein